MGLAFLAIAIGIPFMYLQAIIQSMLLIVTGQMTFEELADIIKQVKEE
jgi:hypothetical protein